MIKLIFQRPEGSTAKRFSGMPLAIFFFKKRDNSYRAEQPTEKRDSYVNRKYLLDGFPRNCQKKSPLGLVTGFQNNKEKRQTNWIGRLYFAQPGYG